MKSGKRELTDGMELPNQDKFRTLGEKRKPTNTRVSKRLTPTNKRKWKIKFKKSVAGELENYSRQNFLAKTLSD